MVAGTASKFGWIVSRRVLGYLSSRRKRHVRNIQMYINEMVCFFHYRVHTAGWSSEDEIFGNIQEAFQESMMSRPYPIEIQLNRFDLNGQKLELWQK